jgi:hypothetical protein
MKTSPFVTALRSHPNLPLVFRAGRETVAPGYHLTEVKRVAYETIDCGAVAHRWSESQFEIWSPSLAKITPGHGHMPAGKFLSILDRVSGELPLNGDATVRIHTSFARQPAALYEIEAVNEADGKLWIELSPDKARCKAAERRVSSATGLCCETALSEETAEETGSGCCGSSKAEIAAAACCA